MSKIVLPPLPKHTMLGLDQYGSPSKYGWSADQLRARDLEVARVVLEVAALKCEGERRLGLDDERAYYGDLMAAAVRALEFKHE